MRRSGVSSRAATGQASGAAVGLAVLTAAYLLALVWIDSRGTFQRLSAEWMPALGVMLLCNAVSVSIRCLRWHWLLSRSGFRLPVGRSVVAYLAGFAFTATPGKLGELVRIRYFRALGVPAHVTTGSFVFERSLDLVAVLALATLAVVSPARFLVALLFVGLILASIAVLLLWPRLLARIAAALRGGGWPRAAGLAGHIGDGLAVVRRWLGGRELVGALLLGLAAWAVQAGAFAWLAGHAGLALEPRFALAVYPLAMLVGAASMLPGGVGSTEAAIVALLADQDVGIDVGLLLAVLTRIATLWSAIVVGVICLARAEHLGRRGQAG